MHTSTALIRCRRGLRAALLATAAAALLAAAPSAALAAGITAKVSGRDHAPIANSYYTLRLKVTKGTTKLSGNVNYEFLLGTQVVSKQKGHAFKNGLYTDRMCFPPAAVGHPLTLGIVVTTNQGKATVDWRIKTRTGKVTDRCKASP